MPKINPPKNHHCTRCNEYHQRLFVIHDDAKNDYAYECLSCVAELLIGRGQHGDHLIGKSHIKNMFKTLGG